jgi:hypothetical protein
MVRVVPLVSRHDFLFRVPQGLERFLGMSAKLDPLVRGLGLLNVMNCIFRGPVRIPQVGMMDFISQGHRRHKNGQRSNDNLFHDFPLRLD